MDWTCSSYDGKNIYSIPVEKSYETKSLVRLCFMGVKICVLKPTSEKSYAFYKEYVNSACSVNSLLVRLC
jgi:hypothetical protein